MDSAGLDIPSTAERKPSPSQLSAIEAPPGPLLVLAGPGAGKTYCLIERIHFLVQQHHFKPSRILAFTFTNKAAGEIEHRLHSRLGDAAAEVAKGTIHAFCADLLRKHATSVGIEPGFGIADEEYQLSVLRRIEGPRRWHKGTLTRFSAHRFREDNLRHDDLILFEKYEKYLARRNVLDFDQLVMYAADLLEHSAVADAIRARWDVVLVDEFQDLNPVQYRVVRGLARDHRHVFAVGDDEQSIYSWAGADPRVFPSYLNDFNLSTRIHLEENRRCPQDVFALARKLVAINTPIFADRVAPRADRKSQFPVQVQAFADDHAESDWLVADVRRDREEFGHHWGDIALLYRTHEIGDRLEAAFLNAGIPCRLPRGHALSDDPVVQYVIAASRVIDAPHDELHREAFFEVVLPQPIFDEARARSLERRVEMRRQLGAMAADLPRGDDTARQIRRALTDLRNLAAVGRQQTSVAGLVQELLSRKVGPVRSVLDDRHDEITDPAALPDVVALAARLRRARDRHLPVWVPPLHGADIPIKGMLIASGVRAVRGSAPPSPDAVHLDPADVTSVELPLAVFKALQLLEMEQLESTFDSFTAIDLETTSKNIREAEIVEIAAVRVRNGKVVDKWSSLVRPSQPIAPESTAIHHIRDEDVAGAPRFADVWPTFAEFCGNDVIAAHNGYSYDFPLLQRAARAAGYSFDLCMFDSLPLARDLFPTSRKLENLARHFGVDTGTSHRAPDDTLALAMVLLELQKMKEARARKTALVTLLDQLGVALALYDERELGTEAQMFRRFTRIFSLGRYSDCLNWYEREQGDDASIPTVDELVELLGGVKLMQRLRAEKSPDERYPAAMQRLRRMVSDLPGLPFEEQLRAFLERVVLSRWDGTEPDEARVNLLTLHSTKGLEFSRVYIVGAEDSQLPGGSPGKEPVVQEVEEARRLLYVGMTRTIDRLVLTRVAERGDKDTGGHRFLDEMGLRLNEA